MSKTKANGVKAAKPEKDTLTKVKDAAVTKPTQTAKAKSKQLARIVAGKEQKKKQKVKEPSPEPESESESDAESESASESDSESAESSEISESEPETKPTSNSKATANGTAKGIKATKDESDSESDAESDSSAESSDSEGRAPVAALPTKGTAVSSEEEEGDSESESDESEDEQPVAKAAAESSAESDSDDDSDGESDESGTSESEEDTKLQILKGSAGKPELTDEESDESGSSEESSEEESESESDEEEVEAVPEPANKKRKAEDVSPFAAKKAKAEADANSNSSGTHLFVGNLAWSIDEAWLSEEFGQYGELVGVRVVTDRDSGRSKGFGYVEYVNAADATKAYNAKKGTELEGRPINVDWATGRSGGGGGGGADRAHARAKSFGDKQSPPSDTLFVGNLAFSVETDTVGQAFGEYGTVTSVRLPTDRDTGAPKGFGYVTFASVDEAKAALEGMQGYELAGRTVRLDFSTPRDNTGDSPRRGGGFGGGRGGRGGFGDRGGRGGFRGGRGGARGGRGGTTNRGGFGDFSGRKTSFD